MFDQGSSVNQSQDYVSHQTNHKMTSCLKLFIDLQCKHSCKAYFLLRKVLAQEVQIGESLPVTYEAKTNIEIIPYALPFNPNSFSVMSIFPFFCNKSQEMRQRYIELCFNNIDENNGLRNEFLSSWQNIVSNHFTDLDP